MLYDYTPDRALDSPHRIDPMRGHVGNSTSTFDDDPAIGLKQRIENLQRRLDSYQTTINRWVFRRLRMGIFFPLAHFWFRQWRHIRYQPSLRIRQFHTAAFLGPTMGIAALSFGVGVVGLYLRWFESASVNPMLAMSNLSIVEQGFLMGLVSLGAVVFLWTRNRVRKLLARRFANQRGKRLASLVVTTVSIWLTLMGIAHFAGVWHWLWVIPFAASIGAIAYFVWLLFGAIAMWHLQTNVFAEIVGSKETIPDSVAATADLALSLLQRYLVIMSKVRLMNYPLALAADLQLLRDERRRDGGADRSHGGWDQALGLAFKDPKMQSEKKWRRRAKENFQRYTKELESFHEDLSELNLACAKLIDRLDATINVVATRLSVPTWVLHEHVFRFNPTVVSRHVNKLQRNVFSLLRELKKGTDDGDVDFARVDSRRALLLGRKVERELHFLWSSASRQRMLLGHREQLIWVSEMLADVSPSGVTQTYALSLEQILKSNPRLGKQEYGVELLYDAQQGIPLVYPHFQIKQILNFEQSHEVNEERRANLNAAIAELDRIETHMSQHAGATPQPFRSRRTLHSVFNLVNRSILQARERLESRFETYLIRELEAMHASESLTIVAVGYSRAIRNLIRQVESRLYLGRLPSSNVSFTFVVDRSSKSGEDEELLLHELINTVRASRDFIRIVDRSNIADLPSLFPDNTRMMFLLGTTVYDEQNRFLFLGPRSLMQDLQTLANDKTLNADWLLAAEDFKQVTDLHLWFEQSRQVSTPSPICDLPVRLVSTLRSRPKPVQLSLVLGSAEQS